MKPGNDRHLEIEVVRGNGLRAGAASPGIQRHIAFETQQAIFSQSNIASGNVSVWHHHGSRELYGYLLSGELRLEFGKGGSKVSVISPGDFFRIPVGLVHRDVNSSANEAVVVSLLVGSGPAVVNVNGPSDG
ncbi:MAG: cupin domain-containing protein [Thaumarchaeota archaeon]|nr:cupin domain-containing protein [Nitrososphaerota archaeon]